MKRVTFAVAAGLIFSSLTISLSSPESGVHAKPVSKTGGAPVGAIYQTSPFGGALKKVADNVWSDFSVSPDGRQLAFVRRDAGRNTHLLILSNVDGSGEHELSARQMPLDYRGAPAWSPDSTRIVIGAGIQTQFFPRLLTVDVATGQETELKIPNWRAITRTLWMPSGKHLIVAAREANEPSSQLWMLPYPDGEIRRLTNDLEAYFWLSLSSNGRMLVTRQQRIVSRLWLMPNGDVKGAKQLTSGERALDGYVGLAWTTDGRIVFSSFAGHNTDLYLINADGSNRIQLTSNAGQDNTHPGARGDAWPPTTPVLPSSAGTNRHRRVGVPIKVESRVFANLGEGARAPEAARRITI